MQQKRTTYAIGALVLQEFHNVIQTDAFAIPEIFGDHPKFLSIPIGSMYAIYGNIYHQYTPNVSKNDIIDKIIRNNNKIIRQ